MKKRLLLGLLLTVLFSSVVLSACSGGKQATVKVKIGEVTRSMFYAPEYVALAKGFFKDEGLDVELQTTAGGDKTMTALLSGGIDVALVGSETSVYVFQQGSDDPIINFAQITQTDGTFLVSRNEVKDFNWDQLKGSVFLGQRKGGMPQMAGEFALKKHGINPQQDMKLIQNIDFANIATAFASGTGDYVQLFEPQASIFEQQGKGHVIASFGVESGHLPYTVFMTKKSFIDKNGDTVQKFTNAIYKAQQWVKENSPETIADTILPYFKDTDRNIAISVVKRYKDQGSYATDPILDEAEWKNLMDVMSTAGELKSKVEHGSIVNNTFAEKSMK
ncbi:hypothetical protein BVG16_23425 [Paenibacillus selenitireducens]|uniref:SsuA/THI5-like domain-containing protein n=1 Tax=Paenibacillus selenitireducens TaxID=1324314 RepID=A0A1T2X4B6_9BACL|nr:ABC transporter substrate-binding protein [Paenibacillus selenitireducens]OPA74709.1 hypothetical protein BVG16_23425 [Paenibacillus selenitireducens]